MVLDVGALWTKHKHKLKINWPVYLRMAFYYEVMSKECQYILMSSIKVAKKSALENNSTGP